MASFIRLKQPGFQIPPDQAIVKADEYLAFVEAEDIIADAERQAQEIVSEAKRLYEREKERGYQEGIAQGKVEMMDQIMDTVSNTVEYFSNVESKIVDIVNVALRKVLSEFDDTELTVRMVKNAMQVVRSQKQVTLRVAPTQVEPVKTRLNEIMSDYAGIAFVEVMGDSRLEAGGCIIETEIGIVNTSVDAQLAALEKTMRKHLGSDN